MQLGTLGTLGTLPKGIKLLRRRLLQEPVRMVNRQREPLQKVRKQTDTFRILKTPAKHAIHAGVV